MKEKFNIKSSWFGYKTALGAFVLMIALGSFFFACKQEHQADPNTGSPNQVKLKTLSAQPMPNNRTQFTVVNGNFDLSGYSWERIVTWTLNQTAGTIAATAYTWQSDIKTGHTDFQTVHRCTFLGVTSNTATTHTPSGWVYPTGQYVSWAGNYTFNSTTNQLTISWTSPALMAGNTEVWQLTSPTVTLSRVNLISSTYNLTHGRGYGSSAPWSSFKTMANIPRVDYTSTTSHSISVSGSDGTSASSISATGFNTWDTAALTLSAFSNPSSPSPYNCLHALQPSTKCIASKCFDLSHNQGIIYHLASHDNNRQMVYDNWCACLPHSEFPDYTGNMHPSAFMQVIDDGGALVGYVGIEAQNPTASMDGYPAYQFTLWDFTQIP